MKKFFKSKKFVIISVLALVVATNAITYAYWKSGLVGSQANRPLDIHIGSGQALESSISFADITYNPDLELIPHTRAPEGNQTTEVGVDFKVKWSADPAEVSKMPVEDRDGTLSVICTSIHPVGEPGLELVNAYGAGVNNKLFLIDDVLTAITVNDTNPTDIHIAIKMNEPANKAQYEQVAGRNMQFTFAFEVVSKDDSLQA